ncbi:hypothetical protein PRUPE_6G174700 [Prunus persica]|uniref:Uncharacterized protein n=1 Tax=Prunus persica TaxID=3760 RepID=A0A251NRV8_PRUPE|nr:hypothetical protein PRUPE_6G174700 [Prunus persica]
MYEIPETHVLQLKTEGENTPTDNKFLPVLIRLIYVHASCAFKVVSDYHMFFETSQNTTYTFNNCLTFNIPSVLRDFPLRDVASTSWGMGLLLVFFPKDNGTTIVDKSNKLFSFSSSSSPSHSCSSS